MSKKPTAAEIRQVSEQLSKLRHWMTGYQQGSGKIIPNEDAARQAILLLQRISPTPTSKEE
jgi:hypothetical protein